MEPIDIQALLAYFNQQQPRINNNQLIQTSQSPLDLSFNVANMLQGNQSPFQQAPTTGLPSVVSNQSPFQQSFTTGFPVENNTQRTLESFLPDFKEGELFSYEGQSYKRTAEGWELNEQGGGNTEPFNVFDYLSAYNPYSTDMQTDFYSLGSFLGAPKGTQGRGLGIASSATAAGLGALRTTLSGLANSQSANRTAQNAREAMARRLYTPQVQYRNQNNSGGNPS